MSCRGACHICDHSLPGSVTVCQARVVAGGRRIELRRAVLETAGLPLAYPPVVHPSGIEPPTVRLRGDCSPAELRVHGSQRKTRTLISWSRARRPTIGRIEKDRRQGRVCLPCGDGLVDPSSRHPSDADIHPVVAAGVGPAVAARPSVLQTDLQPLELATEARGPGVEPGPPELTAPRSTLKLPQNGVRSFYQNSPSATWRQNKPIRRQASTTRRRSSRTTRTA